MLKHRWFNSSFSASVGDSCALKCNIQKLSRNNSSHCVEFKQKISALWCRKIILLLDLPAINLTWLQPWSQTTAFNVKWQNNVTGSFKCLQSSTVQLSSFEAFGVTQIWIRWQHCPYERLSKSLAMTWLGMGIVWVFSDTGAKPVLLKRYRWLNSAWSNT